MKHLEISIHPPWRLLAFGLGARGILGCRGHSGGVGFFCLRGVGFRVLGWYRIP